MKICKKPKELEPAKLLMGNLYECISGVQKGDIYICTVLFDVVGLVNMESGARRYTPNIKLTDYVDVTDKYCLTEVN